MRIASHEVALVRVGAGLVVLAGSLAGLAGFALSSSAASHRAPPPLPAPANAARDGWSRQFGPVRLAISALRVDGSRRSLAIALTEPRAAGVISTAGADRYRAGRVVVFHVYEPAGEAVLVRPFVEDRAGVDHPLATHRLAAGRWSRVAWRVPRLAGAVRAVGVGLIGRRDGFHVSEVVYLGGVTWRVGHRRHATAG